MVYEVRLWQLFREEDNAAKAAPPPSRNLPAIRCKVIR